MSITTPTFICAPPAFAGPTSPTFGNGWQRFMASVARGGQRLNTAFQSQLSKGLVGDTYQSLQYSNDFKLDVREVLPATLTACALLYLLGQEQRQQDDPKAPVRLLGESAVTYALTTYTSNVIPVLGILAAAYSAGQQDDLLNKIKHSGIAALGILGSLLGVWAGMGYNIDKTRLDVSHVLQQLPEARPFLRAHGQNLINVWEPPVPENIKLTADIATHKAQLKAKAFTQLTALEGKLTQHEATLRAYQATPTNGSLGNRVKLRSQLSAVFKDLWEHLHPAQEALSNGLELSAYKDSVGLNKALQLSRRLETLNTGYVRAARWANPMLFGVLFSIGFQLLTPLWEKLCDWVFGNRLGHTELEIPSHTLLNHHDDHGGYGHYYSNTLMMDHLKDRFNAFAGNTHTEIRNVQVGGVLLERSLHGA